ncbi:hypothetical protein [Streptomyces sp. MJP52]|uniref:hypothetical protein n=1 Tax=Streptomyces sp. MJP52 TaxID=2940555 RepID=UPI0024764FC2|nr:hypothetical protein [Streptomyces sp. MJP52]MDH6226238.1 hypothetical protein [Streptomyces sp. MJP52]
MSTEEQPTSGSVPNAFGNALAWKWAPRMSSFLRRSGLPTLLYALRTLASPSGEIAFNGDRKPIRISDIAAAACCDQKDARRYLDAAIRAGVVTIRGVRKRGSATRYVILVSPWPDWQAAEDHLRQTARKPGRKPAAWQTSSGDRAPNKNGAPRPELQPETDHEERGTAPHTSSGDRAPNGSGDRAPNNPGFFHGLSHDGADVGSQPQVVGPAAEDLKLHDTPWQDTPPPDDEPPYPDDEPPEDIRTAAAPEPSGISRCPCGIPLLRPTPDGLCHGCRTHQATA